MWCLPIHRSERSRSYRVVGEDGAVTTERENYEREDFKFTTSNKQLNFLQHIMTIMEARGRAGCRSTRQRPV